MIIPNISYLEQSARESSTLATVPANMAVGAAVVATGALLSFLTWLAYLFSEPPEIFYIKDPKQCRQLIAGDGRFRGKRNMMPRFLSRTLPNFRLRVAFGIDNAFTSRDEVYMSLFVRKSRGLMNLKDTDWEKLSRVLSDTSRPWFQNGEKIHLTHLVQALSMRFVLVTLLKVDPDKIWEIDRYSVRLAEAINQIWMSYKKEPKSPPLQDNQELKACLYALFPACDLSEPRQNPLNLIIPGFDTTWRVVLRMVLEIGFNTGFHHPDWEDSMTEFALTPTKTNFQNHTPPLGVSAEALVLEALRLYPPTKRIHRTFEWDNMLNGSRYAADIEACHLSRDVWGIDAMEYNPLRWIHLTEAQKEAFLPFGSAPFECPAKAVFGPRMIGLIVGVIFLELQLSREWWLVSRDAPETEKHFKGRRLSNDRNAYGDLYLSRKTDM